MHTNVEMPRHPPDPTSNLRLCHKEETITLGKLSQTLRVCVYIAQSGGEQVHVLFTIILSGSQRLYLLGTWGNLVICWLSSSI